MEYCVTISNIKIDLNGAEIEDYKKYGIEFGDSKAQKTNLQMTLTQFMELIEFFSEKYTNKLQILKMWQNEDTDFVCDDYIFVHNNRRMFKLRINHMIKK